MAFTDVAHARIERYNAEMAKGMADKLFFLDRLPRGAALLDFGCADGHLLSHVARLRPDVVLAGLDISPIELQRAAARGLDATWLPSISEAMPWIGRQRLSQRPVALLASSVLHEVQHYGGDRAWHAFWSLAMACDGLALRDFSITRSDWETANPGFVGAVRAGLPLWQRASFEAIWGTIACQGQAVHAALKAPWTDSWEREGPEHYFPVHAEDVHEMFDALWGTPVLWRPHRLAFTDADTQRRFGVGLPCPTHLQALGGPVWLPEGTPSGS